MKLPSVGDVFERRYKLTEILGRGGFAVVYRALDTTVDRAVAVKVLTPSEEGYSSSVASRFLREARVLAGLQDPHTITMYDFGRTEEGLFYMVFEYVAGTDLGRILKMRGRFAQPAVIHILRQLLGALREAHGAGVLHRDLKPANVLMYEYMGDENRVKLIDFGIAKPVDPAQDKQLITRAGMMVGTPRYMSPEQICGEELSEATDIYSLGLIAVELLTERPAIQGSMTREMVAHQLDEEPILLPADLEVSPGFRALVERMVEKEVRNRYRDADAVLRELDRLEGSGRRPSSGRMIASPVAERTLVEPSSAESRVEMSGETPSRAANALVLMFGLAAVCGLVGLVVILGMDTREPPVEVRRDRRPQRLRPPRVAPAPPEVPDEPEAEEGEPALESSEPDAALAVVADTGSERAETGCGKLAPFSDERLFTVSIEGSQRSYLVHIPTNYASTVTHPVVLLFHKSSAEVLGTPTSNGLRTIADEQGLILVTPSAADITGLWWREGDLELVVRALEDVNEMLCIDPTRLFAIGHGSGGRMVERLVCHVPLSAVASTGFRPRRGESNCRPLRPTPMLHLMGKNDPYYPFSGGASCTAYPVVSHEENTKLWKSYNECDGRKKPYATDAPATCTTWSCESPYVTCKVDGGHEWNQELPGFIPTCSSHNSRFPYPQEIWRFFEVHGIAVDGDLPDPGSSPP